MATEFDDARDYALFIRDSKTLRNGNGYATRWSEMAVAALRSAGVLSNVVDGIVPPANDMLWLDKNTDPAGLKEWDSVASAWVPVRFERMFGRAVVTALTITGGTANAVIVAQPANFISDRLYTLTPQAENVEGGVTIQVVGVGTYPVVYPDGGEIGAKELSSARPAVLLFRNGRFEIIWAAAPFEAILTAAKAARDAAAQSAAEASDILDDTLRRSDLQQGATRADRQTDTTDGRVLTVGSFGVGDWLDLRSTAFQTGTPADVVGKGRTVGFADGGGTGLAIPGLANYSYGMLTVDGGRNSADGGLAPAIQRTFTRNDREWRQYALNGETWSSWTDAFDSANQTGFTRAAVATKAIPLAVASILTSGFASPGDGGAAEYFRTDAQPAHELYVQDSTGAFFEMRANTVKLSQAGAFPDTGTTQHVGIQNALDYIIARGGGTVDVDKPGVYLSDGLIRAADYSCKITMTNSGRGTIKAAAGLANNVLMFGQINGGATSTGEAHLFDLIIDNSEGAYVVGDNSCTAMSFRLLNRVFVHNAIIKGGFDPLAGVAATGGDSGIGITQCNFAVITNPDITGQPDTAIYPSWNNTGETGGTVMVFGGRLWRNNLAITPKRNLANLFVYGGLYEEQPGGIVNAWVNNGGWVQGCKAMHIEGVKFRKMVANVVRSVAECQLTLRDCEVVDVGYKYDGTGNVGGNGRAIVLYGTKGAVIENILFEMREWTPVSEYAFYDDTDTVSGTTFHSGGHSIRGITFRNWSRTYVAPAGATDEASLFDGMHYTGGSAPFFTGEATNHQFCYKLQGDAARYERRAGSVSKLGKPRGSLLVDLTSLGSLASGAQTPVQTASAAGIDTSCIVTRFEKLSTFSAQVGILIDGRCLDGAVEFSVRNATASSYDLAGKTVRLHFAYS